MLNLDHQNPSTIRRDEGSTSIAHHIKKEEQLRQKLDHERASKRELVERLHAEKEEIKHKSKLVVDMFKQKITETEAQLTTSQNTLEFVSRRTSLTTELLRDHVVKWKLWNESLQRCDNIESFAEYLLNQPIKFICSDTSATLVCVSDPSEIPALMITELDQILKYILNSGIELESIPYVTVVPPANPSQSLLNRKGSFFEKSESMKYNNESPGRKRSPLTSLNVNTGAFSANNSPLQSPVGSARLNSRPPAMGSKGSSKRRSSSGIGMPGSPSFSFFDDFGGAETTGEAGNTTVVETEQLVLLNAQLSESRIQVGVLTEQQESLNQMLTAERALLVETQQLLETERIASVDTKYQFETERQALVVSLSSERDARAQADQQIASLAEQQASLMVQLDKERTNLAEALSRVAALEGEIVSANGVCTTEREERVKAELEIDVLRQTVTKLDTKVQRLKFALEKSKLENSDVREMLQRERDTHANLLLRHTIELEAAAQAAAVRASEFVAEIEQLKVLAATPATTMAALERDLQSRDVELKELLSQLTQKSEAMCALEAHTEAQISTITSEARDQLQAVKEANDLILEALRAQLRHVETQSDHWYISTQRSSEESMELAEQLEHLREWSAAVSAELSTQLQKSVDAHLLKQQALQASEAQVQLLVGQLSDRTAVVSDLEQKLSELERLQGCLQQDLERSASALLASREQVSVLELQVSEWQSRCTEHEVNYRAELAAQGLNAETMLRNERETHLQALSAMQELLQAKDSEVEELVEKVRARESEIQLLSESLTSQSKMKELLTAAQLDADAQAVELRELKRQFAEQADEVAVKRSAMVARIASLTEDLQTKDATILSLQRVAERVQSENGVAMEALQGQLMALDEEVQEWRRRSAIEAEIAALREQELHTAQSERRHLQSQLNALEASTEAEIRALSTAAARIHEERHAQATKHDNELLALQAECNAASKRCQELEASMQEHSALVASLEAQRLVWESTVAERDQQHALNAGKTSELSHALQQSLLRAKELDVSLAECEAELEMFKECNGRVSEERDSAQEQLEVISAALEAAQSEAALLQSQRRCLEEECVALKKQLHERMATEETFSAMNEEKVMKLQQRLVSIEEESAQREAESDVLRCKLRECEVLISDTDSTVAKRNMEIDLLRQGLRETERSRDSAELKFQECEESFHRVVGKLEVRIADFLTEREAHVQRLLELQTENEVKDSSLVESREMVIRLEREIAQCQQEIETLNADLTIQRQAVLVVYADLNAQSAVINDLESQLLAESASLDANKVQMQEDLLAQQTLFHSQLSELQHSADHSVASLRSNLLAALALEQEEVRTLAAQLNTKTSQYGTLTEQHEILQQRVESMAQECNDLRAQVASLETQSATLRANASKMSDALQKSEEQAKGLNEFIADRNQVIATLEASLKALQAEQLASRQFVVEQEESIYGLQLCVQAAEEDRIALQCAADARVAALELMVAETSEQLRVAVSARDDWIVKHSNLVDETETLKASLVAAEQSIQRLHNSAEAALESHSTEVEGLKLQIAEMEQRNAVVMLELESRLREFEALGADSSEQLRVVLGQRDQAREDCAALQQRTHELSADLASLSKQLIEKEDAYSVLIAQYQVAMSSVEETAQALRRTVLSEASIQEQLESTESQVLVLRDRLSLLEGEVNLSKEQLVATNDELSTVKTDSTVKIADLSARIEELSAQSATSSFLQSQLEQERDQVRAQLDKTLGQVRRQEMELTEYRTACADSATALQVSSQQLDVLLAEKNALLEDLRHTGIAVRERQDELSSLLTTKCAEHSASLKDLVVLQGKIDQLKATIRERDREQELLSASFAAQVSQLECDLQSAQQDSLVHSTALQAARAEHISAQEGLSMRIQDMEQEHNSEVLKLRFQLQELEAQGATLSEQLVFVSEQRDALQSNVFDAEKRLELLSAKHLTTEQSLAALQVSVVSTHTEHAAAVAAYAAQIERVKGSADATVQDFQRQVEESNAQRIVLQAKVDVLQIQLSSLRADLERQQVEHCAMEAAVSAERIQFKLEAGENRENIHRMKKALNKSSLECLALSTSHVSLQEECESLMREQNMLRTRLRAAENAIWELTGDLLESQRDFNNLEENDASTIAGLHAEAERQHNANRELQTQLAASQESLSIAQQALVETERAASASSERHAVTVQEMQNRLSDLESLGANSCEQLRFALEQRDTLQQSFADLKSEVEAIKELKLAAEAAASSLHLELNAQQDAMTNMGDCFEAERISLKHTVASQQEQVTMQSEELTALWMNHHDLTSFADTLKSQLTEKSRLLQETMQTLSAAVKRIVTANVECLALSAELAAVQEKEQSLLMEADAFKRRALTAEKAVKELDDCLIDQSDDFAALHLTSANTIAALRADLDASLNRFEQLAAALHEKEAQCASSTQALSASLMESQRSESQLQLSLDKQTAIHTDVVAEFTAQIEKVEHIKQELEQEMRDMKSKLCEVEDQRAIAMEQLQQAALQQKALQLECDALTKIVSAQEVQITALHGDQESARVLHNSQVENLHRQISTLRDELSDREADCSFLQSEMLSAEAALVRLQARLYAAESAIRNLDQDFIENAKECDVQLSFSAVTIEGLIADLHASESFVSELRANVDAQNETILNLRSSHASLQSALDSSALSQETCIREHLARVAELECQHTTEKKQFENRLSAAEALGADTAQQLHMILHQRDAIETERDLLKKEISLLEDQLSTLQIGRDNDAATHALLVTSLRSALAERGKCLEEHQTTVRELQSALLSAEHKNVEQLAAHQADSATSSEILSRSEMRCADLQREVDTVRKSLITVEVRLSESRAECERQVHAHASTVGTLRAELKEKSACLLEISQALASAEERMEQTSTEMKNYEALLMSAQDQLAHCSADIHRLEKELRDAEEVKSSLEESVAHWRAENAQLEDQRCSSELRCSSLQSNLLEVEKNLRAAQKDFAALADTNATLRQDMETLLMTAQESEDSHQGQVAALRRELLAAQEELKQLVVASADDDFQRQALETKVQELHARLDARDVRIVELESTVQELQLQVVAHLGALEAASQTQSAVCAERDGLQVQQQSQQATIQELQVTVEQLQGQLSAASTDSVTYIETIDRLQTEIAHSLAQVDALTESALNSEVAHQTQVAALLREVAAAQDEMHELHRASVDSEARFVVLEDQLLSLTVEADARSVRVEELNDTVQRLTRSLSDSQDALGVAESALALTKSAHEHERSELLAQSNAHVATLQTLQSNIDLLQRELAVSITASIQHVATIDNLREEGLKLTAAAQLDEETHRATEASLVQELRTAQEEISALNATLHQAETQSVVLEERLLIVTEDCAVQKTRITELESEIASLQGLVAANQTAMQAGERANLALCEEQSKLQAAVGHLNVQVSALQAEVTSQSAANMRIIDQLNAQLEERMAQIECLKVAAKEMDEMSAVKIASLLREITDAQHRAMELTLTVRERDVHRIELERQLNDLSVEISERTKQNFELEHTVQELNHSIAATKDSLQLSENAMQQTIAALIAERDDLFCQLSAQRVSIERLQIGLEDWQTQLAKAVTASEDKDKVVEQQNARIADLQIEVSTLIESAASDSQTYAAKIESVLADVQMWTERAKESKSQCQRLKKQLKEACTESEARAQRGIELENTVTAQNMLIAEKGAELESVQQALAQAQADFNAERSELRAQLDAQHLTVSDLRRAGEELQVQLSAAEVDVVTSTQTIQELREQLVACRTACTSAEETVANLTEFNRDQNTTAEVHMTQIEKLKSELSSLRTELADQISTAESFETKLSRAIEQYHDEQRKVVDLRTQLEVSEASVFRLQAENANIVAEFERVKCEASDVAQDMRARLDANEAAYAAALKREERFEADLAAQQAIVSQLSSEISSKESVIQELERQCEKKTIDIDSLEQQLQAIRQECTDSQLQLDAHMDTIHQLEIQVVELNAELGIALTSALQHQQQQSVHETQVSDLQKVVQRLQEDLVGAQALTEEEQSAHEVENLSLNGRIAENQFLINELSEQVESLTGDLMRSKQSVEELESTLIIAKMSEESAMSQMLAVEQEKTSVNQRLVELESEFSQALTNLTAAESARATAVAKLSLDQASLHEMATQLVEAKAAHQQCQTLLGEQKATVDALNSDLAQKTEKILLLEQRLAERTSAEAMLQAELRTLEQHEATLKAELKRGQADLSIMSARLHDATADIAHVREVHANELVHWRHDIQDRERALQELNNRLLQQMEQNDDLKRLLQEENMTTNKQRRELSERTAQLNELTVDHGVLGAQEHIHSKEVQELKTQLHAAEITVSNLKQELHALTLESANLAVSVKQRQDGIQKLTVTLAEKEQKTQRLHASSVQLTQELSGVRNKLHAKEEECTEMENHVNELTAAVSELRHKVVIQEELLEKERSVWATKSAEYIARLQEEELVVQELNNRLVARETVIAEYEERAIETVSEKQRLESEFSSIREQLQSNLAEYAQEKQSIPPSPCNLSISSLPSASASAEIIASLEVLVKQKDELLKAQTANWNLKIEDLEAHTAQRVESIREALETQFEAQAAAQHIESRMLEDKIATLEGLLSAAQQELHQCHNSHPEPSTEGSDAAALVSEQNSAEEIRCLQAGVTRLRAKVSSKSKQILLLNQQMLKDRQNFQKLKRSLVKLDGLKAAVFANNFNPAVPAPPLPANQVSELFHLGMEEATKKMELKQQKLLMQQHEEFQVIRNTLEKSLVQLETLRPAKDSHESLTALTETISALHAELRDKAAVCQESQRLIQALRQRNSAKEAAHYLALSDKTVECNALRTTLQEIESKLNAQSCSLLSAEPNELQQQAIDLRKQLTEAQVELQVMTQRQSEGQLKFQRAVRTIKVLEARSESLKEECVVTNGELLKLHQKASKKRSEN